MTKPEGLESTSNVSLLEMFNVIPEGQLDNTEIEGGLTWRQTILLSFTHGYLRIPGDEGKDPTADPRLKVRQAVDGALKERFAETGQLEPVKDAIVFCLGVASREYASLCDTAPEWIHDQEMVDGLLELWRDEGTTYATETLARNVLHCMYNPRPDSNS